MTCANWMLTIFAAVIFILTVWPTVLGTAASVWIIAILSILIIIIAWSMVECKACKMRKTKKKRK